MFKKKKDLIKVEQNTILKISGIKIELENLNPNKNDTQDCAIRAIAKVLNLSWEDVFKELESRR